MGNLVIEKGKLVSAEGFDGWVDVPNGVTEICEDAFKDSQGVTGVRLPKTVKRIAKRAFYFCRQLREINLPEGLQHIDEAAFYCCEALEAIEIPGTVRKIGERAFAMCKGLTLLFLGDGIEEVGKDAFTCCSSLTELVLPDSLHEIGEGGFDGCMDLEYISIGKGLWRIGEGAFANVFNVSRINVEDFVVWQDLKNKPSFDGILMIKGKPHDPHLTIPEGTEEIGQYGYRGHRGIEKVTLPDSLVRIGSCAFESCAELTEVSFGKGIRELGAVVFSGCKNLKRINLADLESFCALTVAPGVYPSLGDHFDYAKEAYLDGKLITDLVVPEGVKKINNGFCNYDGLTSVTLPEGFEELGKDAFYLCSNIKWVKLPESLKKIGENAFRYCQSLEEISIPRGVSRIENGAFMKCKSLKHVTITDGITRIDETVFEECPSIESVRVDISDLKTYMDRHLLFYVTAPVSLYMNGEEINELVIPEGVTEIIKFAFRSAVGITSVTIPEGVTKIGWSAFYGCTSLEEVYIPDSVTEIEGNAFAACPRLTRARIPAGAKIADTAFDNIEFLGASTEDERLSRYYRYDESAADDEALTVNNLGKFLRTSCDMEERRMLLGESSRWILEETVTTYTDRCGSDYEFCYDDDSTTTTLAHRLYPENCLVKDGEIVGFIREGVVILISEPTKRESIKYERGRFNTEVTNTTYKLVRKY